MMKRNDLEENKPVFYMSEEDFTYTLNNYGVDNFRLLYDYININNLSVEDACDNLSINEDQVDTIKLLCARQYYSEGKMLNGDILFNEVKANPSETTSPIINEINSNRLFYQYRQPKRMNENR